MRPIVITYIALNMFGLLLAAGALFLYPKDRGFTITAAGSTHFLRGDVSIAVALIVICNASSAIGLTIEVLRRGLR
jgi:hypothetical protein